MQNSYHCTCTDVVSRSADVLKKKEKKSRETVGAFIQITFKLNDMDQVRLHLPSAWLRGLLVHINVLSLNQPTLSMLVSS